MRDKAGDEPLSRAVVNGIRPPAEARIPESQWKSEITTCRGPVKSLKFNRI